MKKPKAASWQGTVDLPRPFPRVAYFGLLWVGLLVGCDLHESSAPPVPLDRTLDFGELYAKRCSGCHGADGKLGPAPPLNDALFLAIVPDAELVRVITEGRAVSKNQKTPMPAFARERGGPLTAAQVKVLAEGLKKHWGSNKPPSSSTPAYFGPGKHQGSKDNGARVFARACAGCHGDNGKSEKDEPLEGGELNDPAFLRLTSDQALRRIIITGRKDLGMPPYDSKHGRGRKFQPLTDADIDDLVALLKFWRQNDS